MEDLNLKVDFQNCDSELFVDFELDNSQYFLTTLTFQCSKSNKSNLRKLRTWSITVTKIYQCRCFCCTCVHTGEKGRPTDIQSYTSYKYCSKLGVFITKMIYKQKFQGQWISNWRFNFFWKARRKKKSVERRMRKHARAYSKFYSE